MPGLAQVWNRLCCLPPDNSAMSVLHYTLLWQLEYTQVKIYEPERQPFKSQHLVPNVGHPSIYIYGIPKVGLLTDNAYAYITVTTATIHTSTVMSFQMPLP